MDDIQTWTRAADARRIAAQWSDTGCTVVDVPNSFRPVNLPCVQEALNA